MFNFVLDVLENGVMYEVSARRSFIWAGALAEATGFLEELYAEATRAPAALDIRPDRSNHETAALRACWCVFPPAKNLRLRRPPATAPQPTAFCWRQQHASLVGILHNYTTQCTIQRHTLSLL